MSQKFFQIFRSQISDLKTGNVDYLKKPPWKKNFFDIFAIHLTSRYEKRCRMLQRLFSLFQGSKNQLWIVLNIIHAAYVTTSFHSLVLIRHLLEFHGEEKPFECPICNFNFLRFHSIHAKNVPKYLKQST